MIDAGIVRSQDDGAEASRTYREPQLLGCTKAHCKCHLRDLKAATDKMTADMAHELRENDIAVLSLYPELGRTEAALAAAQAGWLDLKNSESPEFASRIIAALTRDSTLMERSGNVFVVASLAAKYGITDVDGRQTEPLTLARA